MRADHLHHIGVAVFFGVVNFGCQRRDIDCRIGQWRQYAADIVRQDGREIALQIDHEFDVAGRIEGAKRLVNPVGAGGVVGARHDRLAAVGRHRRRNFRRVGCDRDPADPGGFGPAQHMDDHRQAGDIQQRLSGQPGGGHAGGNQHQSAGFGHRNGAWTGLLTGRK